MCAPPPTPLLSQSCVALLNLMYRNKLSLIYDWKPGSPTELTSAGSGENMAVMFRSYG